MLRETLPGCIFAMVTISPLVLPAKATRTMSRYSKIGALVRPLAGPSDQNIFDEHSSELRGAFLPVVGRHEKSYNQYYEKL
jgi:hypothetical protein